MSVSLRNILNSLRQSQKRRQNSRSSSSSLKKSKTKSSSKMTTTMSKMSKVSTVSKSKSKSKSSGNNEKFGCSFRRSTGRCVGNVGSDYVDSSCRRVIKHGEKACRLTRKVRSYKRRMSARSLALLR
jgi:hypothetical protein